MPILNGREYMDPLDVMQKMSPFTPSIESFIGCLMVFQTSEKEGDKPVDDYHRRLLSERFLRAQHKPDASHIDRITGAVYLFFVEVQNGNESLREQEEEDLFGAYNFVLVEFFPDNEWMTGASPEDVAHDDECFCLEPNMLPDEFAQFGDYPIATKCRYQGVDDKGNEKPATRHVFHSKCLKDWERRCRQNHQPFTCPDCRAPLNEEADRHRAEEEERLREEEDARRFGELVDWRTDVEDDGTEDDEGSDEE